MYICCMCLCPLSAGWSSRIGTPGGTSFRSRRRFTAPQLYCLCVCRHVHTHVPASECGHVCLSVYLSVYLSIYPCIHRSIRICLAIHLVESNRPGSPVCRVYRSYSASNCLGSAISLNKIEGSEPQCSYRVEFSRVLVFRSTTRAQERFG